MNTAVVPLPPAAIVVDDKTYREIASDPSRVHRLEAPDSLVIPYSAEPVARPDAIIAVRNKLIDRDLLVMNQLLVRNPYDVASYSSADDAIEAFVKAKYYHLASIAALLGASSIEFVKVEVEKNKSDLVGKAKADLKLMKGSADVGHSLKKLLDNRFEAKTELGGRTADIDAARAFMLERRLSNDPDVVGLIDLCSTGNPLQKHRMKVNGLLESAKTLKAGLELAAAIDTPAGVSASFSRAVESISSIEVTTVIAWEHRP